MFNRRASSSKSRPGRIIRNLAINAGESIADIGAGGGYYTFRFAELVGSRGKVFAVDVKSDFLRYLNDECRENGYDNVVTINSDVVFSSLPKNGLDLVFLRNVYHHLPNRTDYFKAMIRHIKPGGRVVILDYRSNGGFSVHQLFGHYVPPETIIREMEDAGYRLSQSFDFLQEQSFLIFRPRMPNKD
jgi:predicted methyltransferase